MGLFGKSKDVVSMDTTTQPRPPRVVETPYLEVTFPRRYYSFNVHAEDLKEAGIANADEVLVVDFMNFLNTHTYFITKRFAFSCKAVIGVTRYIDRKTVE